jgi:hypothetical protein
MGEKNNSCRPLPDTIGCVVRIIYKFFFGVLRPAILCGCDRRTFLKNYFIFRPFQKTLRIIFSAFAKPEIIPSGDKRSRMLAGPQQFNNSIRRELNRMTGHLLTCLW